MDIITNNIPEFAGFVAAVAGLGVFKVANFLINQTNEILKGTSARAKITNNYKMENSYSFNYEFEDHKGVKQLGNITGVEQDAFSVGQEIEIMYNVSNPQYSVYPPRSEHRIKTLNLIKKIAIVEMTIMPVVVYIALKFFS